MQKTVKPSVTQKCWVYRCRNRARVYSVSGWTHAVVGFCEFHYDRHITPPKSWPKKRLLRFMTSVERMLSAEYGVSLGKSLVPRALSEISKGEVRHRYKELWRSLDARIVPKLRAQARREGFGMFASPSKATWEEVCLAVSQALYGEVLFHPLLPNGQVPDLVPVLKGIKMDQKSGGPVHVLFAPLIIDAKFSMVPARSVRVDYGSYCDRLEVWNLRWEPKRLDWRTPGVVYQAGHELAIRLDRKDQSGMAKLLRRLPLLWGLYEMAELYGYGARQGAALETRTWDTP